MERHVVSREWAEKLSAAGYPQKSEFTWYLDGDDTPALNWTNQSRIVGGVYHTDKCAAPLSDELLEQLPKLINDNQFLTLTYPINLWVANYTWSVAGRDVTKLSDMLTADKPADALAQLWLWCVDNGYIQPEGGK